MSQHTHSAQTSTMNVMFSRIKWQIFRLSEALSWLGKLALLMMVLGLFYWLMVITPKQKQLASLLSLPAPQAIKQLEADPTQQILAYAKQFPKAAQRTTQINRMVALAKESQLLMDEVSYKTQQQPEQMFSQTSVEFSVVDTYPKIHHFLNSLLTEMPFMAIDSLSLNRENVLDDVLEARIKLTFYFAQT